MKKFLLLLVMLLSLHSVFSQETKQDYLQKSKRQKTIAWITLAGGTPIGFIGLTQINLAGSDGDINNGPGTVMFFTGLASTLVSIPLFVASKRNKKLAMNLSFRRGVTPAFQGIHPSQKSQTSVYLKIAI